MSGFIISMGIAIVVSAIAIKKFEMRENKEEILIALDERYKLKADMLNATIKKLEKKGKKCDYVSENKIKVDGEVYNFSEVDIALGRLPLQQIILKHI